MDVRHALKEQYLGGLKMLAQCVERCPQDLWIDPNWPIVPGEHREGLRAFWRIAFHDIYFTHLYLGQGIDAFQPPSAESGVGSRSDFDAMWRAPWDLEPYDLPQGTEPCRQSEMLEYIAYVHGLIDATVDDLDLDTEESGFPWYKRISKLSHQMMNLRHLQGHVGQLSELLMKRGIDIDWTARSPAAART